MIKKLKYSEIDFEAYSRCISNSIQNNFYAGREILDLLCNGWEVLVYGDYEFVMPIPIQRKYGIKHVSMPVFIQQLGVFGFEENVGINEKFLQKLLELYIVVSYSFNQYNKLGSPINVRKNYIIATQPYEQLYKNRFSKGRKSVLKKTGGLTLQKNNLDTHTESFILSHFKGLNKNSELRRFVHFIREYSANLQLWHVYSGIELVSLAVISENEKSFGLLALINNDSHRHLNAASYLINEFLKREIANKSLDLMGGNIRGIEIFFKSFGADLVTYPVLQNSKRALITNILNRKKSG